MTTHTIAPPAHRPDLHAWLTLFVSEAKMVIRDTAGLVVPIALPLITVLTSATIARQETVGDTGLTGIEAFVLPLVFAMVMAYIGILNMPSFLAYYRRTGILRRLSVTPASPAMVLVAQTAVSMVQALVGMGLALGVAVTFFDARFPVSPWVALGVLVLSAAAFYGVGLIVASVAPTPNAAVAMGVVLFFGVSALGGMFGGRSALPDFLATLGEYLPFGATMDSLSAAWLGQPVAWEHLVALAAAAAIGGVVAALLFRWE